jgi:hypothetical protein
VVLRCYFIYPCTAFDLDGGVTKSLISQIANEETQVVHVMMMPMILRMMMTRIMLVVLMVATMLMVTIVIVCVKHGAQVYLSLLQ